MSSSPKPPIGDNLMKKRIQQLVLGAGYDAPVLHTVLSVYDYMRHYRHGFFGGCHALSSVLYVLFCELNLAPELFIGECRKNSDPPFDHSWITVNHKILDLALYMPLKGMIGDNGGPVIFDIDALTMEGVQLSYGINTGLPMSHETVSVMEASFPDYMTHFPREPGGLWTVVGKAAPEGLIPDLSKLPSKYSNVSRIFVR